MSLTNLLRRRGIFCSSSRTKFHRPPNRYRASSVSFGLTKRMTPASTTSVQKADHSVRLPCPPGRTAIFPYRNSTPFPFSWMNSSSQITEKGLRFLRARQAVGVLRADHSASLHSPPGRTASTLISPLQEQYSFPIFLDEYILKNTEKLFRFLRARQAVVVLRRTIPLRYIVRPAGIEPATVCLKGNCSTD